MTAFTRRYTANHLGTVSNSLLRVESTLGASETLTNYFGIFVN
ncbi:hypothetical protein AEST_15760 [Alishewanella aestuarii B11]|uniref:Uncharacterized protein n=1 Tax=Alishewanella aestuarii B11 TaxID=1197174 RepID=J1YCP4_9ALTE|nr:hypothetical protein AEST_15760 [Alishewanella aestuarii B11]